MRLLASVARRLLSALFEPAVAHAFVCSRENGEELQTCGSCPQPVCCQIGRNCCFSYQCPAPPPACPGGICTGGGAGGGGIGGSIDPNDKVGVTGAGPARFVSTAQPLRYTIFFENLPTATLPAQEVVITDQLDVASLDLASFSLGPIDYGGGQTVVPPPGLSRFTTSVDFRPVQDLVLRVDAQLDPITGLATWRFVSLDPSTLQLAEDPQAGFLPPNTTPPAGEGSVQFSVVPRAGLSTGSPVSNRARIVFDANAPIDTPAWLNTVDDTPPTSRVTAVGPPGPQGLPVTWAGADVGAGIQDYTVLVSENGGPFTAWRTDTTATTGFFPAACATTYAFYSVARDHAGNVEDAPATADATLAVGACDLAITSIKAPGSVDLSRKASRVKTVTVQVQNRSPHAGVIRDAAALARLVALDVESLGACPVPAVALRPQLFKRLPIRLRPRQALNVSFDVTFDCVNDPHRSTPQSPGHGDYRITARLDRLALGALDTHPDDDVCPRSVPAPGVIDPHPDGTILDRGCGARKADGTLGGAILVDVIRRP